MESNKVYETIIELGGNCFMADERPPCEVCPFKEKCLLKMINEGGFIPKERRLSWALNELAEEYLLNDYANNE